MSSILVKKNKSTNKFQMVADNINTQGSFYVNDETKIFKVGKIAIGGTGSVFLLKLFKEYVEAQKTVSIKTLTSTYKFVKGFIKVLKEIQFKVNKESDDSVGLFIINNSLKVPVAYYISLKSNLHIRYIDSVTDYETSGIGW